MQKLALGILSLSLFLAACEDPASSKPKATLSNSTNAASNSQLSANDSANAQAKGTRLVISPDNSKVEFTGSKVTGKHEGGFKRFDGFIDLVNDKVENSKVSVDIEMNSVFTDTDAVTKHLQTGDFFEVDKYPNSTFGSTQIVADGDKGAGNYMVTGDLELHGIKKAITFPAQISIDPEEVSVNSEFAINRKDFGIVYAGKADDLIRDNVVIHLDLKAPRKK